MTEARKATPPKAEDTENDDSVVQRTKRAFAAITNNDDVKRVTVVAAAVLAPQYVVPAVVADGARKAVDAIQRRSKAKA